MDAQRFDSLTKSVFGRVSRRTVLGGGAGLAVALGTLGSRRAGRAHSLQEGAASPVAIPAADEGTIEYLFVQTAAAGTWAPKPNEPDTFLLTLTGASAQTIYFSDRPARVVGSLPTATVLASLGFTPADPPNAAIVAQAAAGEDVLVVELFSPRYDEAAGTLTYEARVLTEYVGAGLGTLPERRADDALPPAFGPTSLFIDDANCPSQTQVDCALGDGTVLHTYDGLEECLVYLGSSTWDCCPCTGSTNGDGTNLLPFWSAKCNTEVSACGGNCSAGVYCG
jgi:hypothetical protein